MFLITVNMNEEDPRGSSLQSEVSLGLLLLRGEQPEEHVPVLVVKGSDIHAEGVSYVV